MKQIKWNEIEGKKESREWQSNLRRKRIRRFFLNIRNIPDEEWRMFFFFF